MKKQTEYQRAKYALKFEADTAKISYPTDKPAVRAIINDTKEI